MATWKHTEININGRLVKAQAPIIISASRSTDIPAFYADWFFKRLEIGFSAWTNPFKRIKSYVSYEMGLIKNKYVGRTFIQPTQEMRDCGKSCRSSKEKLKSSRPLGWEQKRGQNESQIKLKEINRNSNFCSNRSCRKPVFISGIRLKMCPGTASCKRIVCCSGRTLVGTCPGIYCILNP